MRHAPRARGAGARAGYVQLTQERRTHLNSPISYNDENGKSTSTSRATLPTSPKRRVICPRGLVPLCACRAGPEIARLFRRYHRQGGLYAACALQTPPRGPARVRPFVSARLPGRATPTPDRPSRATRATTSVCALVRSGSSAQAAPDCGLPKLSYAFGFAYVTQRTLDFLS